MPTLVTPDGRRIQLPPGVTEADVAAHLQKYDPDYGKSSIERDDPNPPKSWTTGKPFPPGPARVTEELGRGAARGVMQDATALGNLSPGAIVSRGIDYALGKKPHGSVVEQWANDPNISTVESLGRFAGSTLPMMAVPETGLPGIAARAATTGAGYMPTLAMLAEMARHPLTAFFLGHRAARAAAPLSRLMNSGAATIGREAGTLARGAEMAVEGKALREAGDEGDSDGGKKD